MIILHHQIYGVEQKNSSVSQECNKYSKGASNMFKMWQDLNNNFITNLLSSFTVTEFHKNSSGYEIANVNFYAVRPEAS